MSYWVVALDRMGNSTQVCFEEITEAVAAYSKVAASQQALRHGDIALVLWIRTGRPPIVIAWKERGQSDDKPCPECGGTLQNHAASCGWAQ